MKINIASNEVIHFIGIGGIGMSGLAQIMKNMGFTIQGSDLNRNKNTERLVKSGIRVFFGHDKKNVQIFRNSEANSGSSNKIVASRFVIVSWLLGLSGSEFKIVGGICPI